MRSLLRTQRRLAITNMEHLKNAISSLPEIQQQCILACVEASNTSPNGVRYTAKWVYQCVLLKLKSARVYAYLRREKVLPLPAINTIYRYKPQANNQ